MSVRRIAVLVVVAGVVAVLMFARDPETEPETVLTSAGIDLSSSQSCRECHAAVFAEWESSYHALSFLDPLVRAEGQADNFRKLDCIPCHAPAPILEHEEIGKDTRVYERFAYRDEGVDCLACHRMGDRVAATSTLPPSVAPCQPERNAILPTATLCAPCHNQHQTIDEWEQSSYHAQGIGCNDCHMPEVKRVLADGSTKVGRSHRFLGAHDLETLQSAAEVRTEVAQSESGEPVVRVSISNTGCGHNFPTDARHRALDLVVTLIQEDGVEVAARESRPVGRERGTARRRFRNPYRQETEQFLNEELYGRRNTQIRAGETIVFDVPFDPGRVAHARVELIFKLTPLQTDAEGMTLVDRTLELREGQP